MATISFAGATGAARLDLGDLVARDETVTSLPFLHAYDSTSGNRVELVGSLLYGADRNPVGGTIREARLKLDAEGAANGMRISNLDADAAAIDFDDPASFWNEILVGNDVFDLGGLAVGRVGPAASVVFGDDLAALDLLTSNAVTDAGGNDIFLNAAQSGTLVGDVLTLQAANGGAVTYAGGADSIIGGVTAIDQTFLGDARQVLAGSRLAAGDDSIRIGSSSALSLAAGDAAGAGGAQGATARVEGGDDTITGLASPTAALNARATLVGDVEAIGSHAEVIGGADRIAGSNAGEFIAGDVGRDIATVAARIVGGDDTVTAGGGDDVVAGDLLVAYPFHESLKGAAVVTGGADVLRGGDGADRLFGELGTTDLAALAQVSGGADRLFGGSGDDALFAQTGNDVLNGGEGADDLQGGAGTDRASYADARAGVTANLAAAGLNRGEAAGDRYGGIENLEGSAFADTLVGNAGANRLIGGRGVDTLTGGEGRDVFAFGATAETTAGGQDVILDFVRGTDRIDLSAIDANAGANGNQAFAFVGGAGFSGAAGQLRVVRATSDTFIEADVNGDRVADLAIRLDDPLTLAASDFIL